MKFQLSKGTLKKLLTGTTIINYLFLVTYVFLLISTSFNSHFVFLLAIPAYVLSKSWLLIIGLFGFEILLITYYWYKNKLSFSNEKEVIVELDDFTSEVIFKETENTEINSSERESEIEEEQEIDIDDLLSLESEEETTPYLNIPTQHESTPETTQLEMEFDKLWEDAIEHVRSANSNDKKKAPEPTPIVNYDMTLNEALAQTPPPSSPKKKRAKKKEQAKAKNLKHLSQSLTPKIAANNTKKNYSIILDKHREFYNEVALNNWIYAKKADRESIGKFKIALDETRFREKDITYLIDAGVLFKLLVPHPNGSFCIYSIYEGEDKKIINHYLTDFCKKHKIAYSQKTISIVNYRELGLDKRIWRLDFQIRNDLLGLIWISNFLISDDQTKSYSLSFQKKKEVKALLAASQLQFTDRETFPLIITTFNEDVDTINNYIHSLGYGKAYVLAIGEENFEEKLLKITQK